jgi:hypothetical protein
MCNSCAADLYHQEQYIVIVTKRGLDIRWYACIFAFAKSYQGIDGHNNRYNNRCSSNCRHFGFIDCTGGLLLFIWHIQTKALTQRTSTVTFQNSISPYKLDVLFCVFIFICFKKTP